MGVWAGGGADGADPESVDETPILRWWIIPPEHEYGKGSNRPKIARCPQPATPQVTVPVPRASLFSNKGPLVFRNYGMGLVPESRSRFMQADPEAFWMDGLFPPSVSCRARSLRALLPVGYSRPFHNKGNLPRGHLGKTTRWPKRWLACMADTCSLLLHLRSLITNAKDSTGRQR